MQIQVFNSFSVIHGIVSPDVDQLLKALLTYKNDIEGEKGQLFFQMKLAKRYNNRQKYGMILAKIKHLEANEFVCLLKGNQFPSGLLNIVLEGLRALGTQFELVDMRKHPGETALLRWNNAPWNPRYYQKEMIKLGMQSGRGVFVSAVGTGKSLIMANLVKETNVNTLIIVPSKGLSGQLYNDFESWFGHRNVDLLDAAKIRKGKRIKPINITTVQSLGSLQKTGDFKKFAEDIDALHVDEIHHSGASTYTSLLPDLDHVYYRFGYTGTFLRNDNKTLEMWSFLSNVLYEYPAFKAMQEGYLVPVDVIVHAMTGKRNKAYQKEYDANYCGNPELMDRIHSICVAAESSQILILVSRKDKSGKLIFEYLQTLGINCSYISGDDSSDTINQTISAFNDKKINVLIGSSVIGEGIDVRSTDHLIMAQGGKSEIVMVQAAGRLIRLYPGKTRGVLHDFQFRNTQYMERHLDERLEVYGRNFQAPIRYA